MQVVERCSYGVGDTVDGRYRIEGRLGEGSFGVVYKVSNLKSGEVDALKILKLWAIPAEERELLKKRFDREYETAHIASDYLVNSLSKGETKGNPYIVMEFCPGGDLQGAVKRHNVDLSAVAGQVLHGLHDLHKNGKVHRDLKPENVLIKADGRAALTDFGIAGDRNNRLTRRGVAGIPKQIFGTYAYMPPEQANPRRGNATVLPTTDIFSFGVVMYEMLVGVLPFGRLESEKDLLPYVNNGKNGKWDRSALSRVARGPEWLQLLERCMEPDFSVRAQTAAEVLKLVPKSRTGGDEKNVHIELDNADWSHSAVNGLLLHVMEGEEHGRIYRLNDMLSGVSRVITMGRCSDDWRNRINLKEEESCYVSRRHCTFEWDNERMLWIVRDGQWVASTAGSEWRQSLNGTYLNSREVDKFGSVILPGDIITVGDIKMRVEGY